MLSECEINANRFASKYGVKLREIDCEYRPYWDDDKECRYVFKMRLIRNRKSYTFTFGQSLFAGSKTPTMYDVLSCLQKYDCGTFEDFCREYGYDTDSRRAERTYKGCVKEYNAIVRLFGNSGQCYDELCEIC
jgi:hypothetical protein